MIICGRGKFWQVLITNNGQAGRDFGGPWIWIMDHSATFAIEKETQSGQRRVFSMKCPRLLYEFKSPNLFLFSILPQMYMSCHTFSQEMLHSQSSFQATAL
jgi:hypothetical protein